MDAIPLFFFLSGVLFYLKNKMLSSVLTLSYAIYTKPWPVLFIIPLIKKSKQKMFFLFLCVFPLLLTLIYALFSPTPILDIFEKVKNHRGIFGAWGISKIALYLTNYHLSPYVEQLMGRIFILAFIVFSLIRKDKNVLKTILAIMLFLFVFSPTFGIQWFTWLVPFIIIVRPRLWRLFIVLVGVYIAFGFTWDAYQYFRDIMPFWNSVINRVGFIVWIFIIVMFWQNVLLKTAEGQKN